MKSLLIAFAGGNAFVSHTATPPSLSLAFLRRERLLMGTKQHCCPGVLKRAKWLRSSTTLRGGWSSIVLQSGEGDTLGDGGNASLSSTPPINSQKIATTGEGEEERLLALDNIQPHSLTAKEVLDFFSVTKEYGLREAEAIKRLSLYGPNTLTEPQRQSLLSMFLEQFEDGLVRILLVVAVLSGFLSFFEGEGKAFIEPASILVILILNAAVGVWQSHTARGSLDALKKLQPEMTTVLRDGKWLSNFLTKNLVPGDVLYLKVGDRVPADGRLLALKTTRFSTDEASLTGESIDCTKEADPVLADNLAIASKTNMVFGGTMVTGGGGWVVVSATGMRTEVGKIQAGVQEAKKEGGKTPLEQKLDEFGRKLTYVIGGICVVVWLANIPHFNDPIFGSHAAGAVYFAKVAVALGVAAIPEGLPAVITLCLSLGTRRMASKNVIVRKLPSVETLGCTTVICTDKTGTLTTGQMAAVSLLTVEEDGAVKELEITGGTYEPVGDVVGLPEGAMKLLGWQYLAHVCAMCNDAHISFQDGKYIRSGEPTEAALCVLVEKLGVPGLEKSSDPVVLASQCARFWGAEYARIATLEFSRDRKSMSVLVRSLKDNNERNNKLFVKGAPELLLDRCSSLMLPSGKIVHMTGDYYRKLSTKMKSMAERPLRCILLALKDGREMGDIGSLREGEGAEKHPKLRELSNFANLESDLTFVGAIGIMDPARPEVPQAMVKCQEAGVRVVCITGDSKETAIAIAREVNIFSKFDDVTNRAWVARDFFSLDKCLQKDILATGNILFCRTQPLDKQRIVKMLQELGEVTAMTGDGVNDAPALQQAAIGIAMGISGTEVSKDASDMIITDDNFATIIKAVEEGRAIFSNIQAFICFLISCNIGEILTILTATILGLPEPLTPLHLLWVNLVTDGPPATALGFNPPEVDSMSKPPRPKDGPILTTRMLIRYVVTGAYVGLAAVGIMVHWFLKRGVTWKELSGWSECSHWDPTGLEDSSLKGCSIFAEGMAKPQSLSLTVLVVIEMLKALSAVSVDNSMLRVPPWRNGWLIAGVALPSILHLAMLYTPSACSMLGLAPLTIEDWFTVLRFSLPILLVEEMLKVIGRRGSIKKQTTQKPNITLRGGGGGNE